MPNILITGANRGLGLEFVRQYKADGWDIVATARESSAELESLGIRVEQLDMSDLESVATFGQRLDSLDVMIANAGMMGDPATIDPAEWIETLKLNSIGPTLLALALKDAVLASDQKKMVAITSRLGSIAQNGAGSYVAYRSSKAALNAGGDSFAFAYRHFESSGWKAGRAADAFFDTAYYLAHNADVAAAHIDPLAHYDQYGWKEGRAASAAFDTKAYLAANPDVAAAHIDPLLHYLEYGALEGRHLA